MAAAGVPAGSYCEDDGKRRRSGSSKRKALDYHSSRTEILLKSDPDSVKSMGRKRSVVWKVFTQIAGTKNTANPQTQCGLCDVKCRNPHGSTTAMRNHLYQQHPEVMYRLENGLYLDETSPSKKSKNLKSEFTPLAVNIKRERLSSEGESEQDAAGTYDSIRKIVSCTDVVKTRTSSVNNIVIANKPNQTLTIHGLLPVAPAPANVPLISNGIHPLVANNLDKYKSIATMCILELLPLSTITTPAFRAMMTSFEGGIPIPCNDLLLNIVAKHIDTMYRKQKQDLLEELKGHKMMCFTAECVKRTVVSYMVMYTVNYVLPKDDKADGDSEWLLRSKFVGVQLFPIIPNGSSEQMRIQIVSGMETLLGPSLTVSRSPLLVLNYGSFCNKPNNFTRTPMLFSPCFYEILDGLLTIISRHRHYTYLSNFIDEIFSTHFPREYSRSELVVTKILASRSKFEEYFSLAGYPWESVMYYANAIANVTGVIETFISEQPGLLPLSIVLPSVERLRIQLRRKFQDQVPELYTELDMFIKDSYDLKCHGEGTIVLTLATFLDPRFKGLPFTDRQVSVEVHERVLTKMKDIAQRNSSTPDESRSSMSMFLETPEYLIGDARVNSCEDELKRYVAAVKAPLETNPLKWWHANRRDFPILSKLAKSYGCACGSAVSAKHYFKCSDVDQYNKLLSIEDEFVNKCFFLKNAYPGKYFDIEQPPDLHPQVNVMALKQEFVPDSAEINDSGISSD